MHTKVETRCDCQAPISDLAVRTTDHKIFFSFTNSNFGLPDRMA